MNRWFRVQRCGQVAHVFIHDLIGCFGIGASELLTAIGDALEVRLTVNSTGGDAAVAVILFESLRKRVSVCDIMCSCYSSAVLLALTAERVRIVRDGRMCLHAPSLAVFSDAAGLRQSAAYLDGLSHRWLDILCKRTQAKPGTVRRWLSGKKDVWFTAEEAVKVGLAHEIIELPSRANTAGTIDAKQSDDFEKGEGEEFLLSLLRAVGQIQTQNRHKLVREIATWCSLNVRQSTSLANRESK